ncbi:MAG TPA: hypothetical protein VGK13_05875 [Methanocellaceae archaeon]
MTGSKNIPNSHTNLPKKASSHQDHSRHEKPKFEHDNKLPSSAQVNRVQTNKILELQMEALEKKLGDKSSHGESGDVERLRSQLREKDAELQRAIQKISELRRQLQSLEEKSKPQARKPVHQHPEARKDVRPAQHENRWKQAPKPAEHKSILPSQASEHKPMAPSQAAEHKPTMSSDKPAGSQQAHRPHRRHH